MTSDVSVKRSLSVAILAGGASRRMGRDKAMIRIGQATLLELTARAVCSLSSDLFVVASDRHEYARLGFRLVPDMYPGSGSLGGVFTAVSLARHDHCLVVACDMPMLNTVLLRHMSGLVGDYDAVVPVLERTHRSQDADRTLESLHAIYARSSLPTLERLIAADRLKIADALRELNIREIGESELRKFDPELVSFVNVNTPEDVDLVRRMVGERS